jgi:ABC-type polar amino acid transport system ATPase subunit
LHFGSTTSIYTSFPGCQRIDNALGHYHDVPTADINRVCRKMGMVFQHFNLFAHLTVLQNTIETPMTVKAAARDEITPKHLNRTIVC